jgi:protein O-mannosyl-transferase
MNVEANRAMGSTLAVLGRTNDAISYFSQALKTEPNDPNTHFQLGSVLSQAGRKAEAIQHYEAVLRVQPDSVAALNNLAWIKATSVNPDLRDGVEAVRLAQRACEITKESQPFLLGTLAAALAEAGRFPEAVAAARKARDLATSAGLKDVAARNTELLALYEANRPCRE